jgi:hypothetical protein
VWTSRDLQTYFFECFLANFCWWTFRDALGWTQTPVNLNHFLTFSCGKGDSPKPLMIFLLAHICWSLWLTRNDYVFNNKVVQSPFVVIHRSMMFMQKWSILPKMKEREWVMKTMDRLSRHLEQNDPASDVGGVFSRTFCVRKSYFPVYSLLVPL